MSRSANAAIGLRIARRAPMSASAKSKAHAMACARRHELQAHARHALPFTAATRPSTASMDSGLKIPRRHGVNGLCIASVWPPASGMQLASWDRSQAKLRGGQRSLLGSLVNSKARGEFAGIFRIHAVRRLHDGHAVMEMAGHAMAWSRIAQLRHFASAPRLNIQAAPMEAATAGR